ncbi:MAG: YgjV family protein [Candidatus Marinimicrobia bacterium]|nr:YgjV family protein [Candidatus Neomarinimicrobiota bacterium]
MDNIYEIIGYIASLTVAISLSMSSLIRLRWINLGGSAVFSLYGFLIHAYPVGIMNGYIALMNLYYLVKIYKSKDDFRVLTYDHKTQYLEYFFNFYKKDIRKFNPEFNFQINEKDKIFIILRNMMPAGIVIGNCENGIFNLRLDFVIPQFRDFKVGNFIYRHQNSFLYNNDIKVVIANTRNKKQANYYQKMGFAENNGKFAFVI